MTSDGERELLRRPWPGNVRELRNAIERACLLSEDERIDRRLFAAETGFDDVVEGGSAGASATPDAATPMPRLEDYLRLRERDFIRQALQRHDFQVGVTVDALGISRKSLWERVKRLAID